MLLHIAVPYFWISVSNFIVMCAFTSGSMDAKIACHPIRVLAQNQIQISSTVDYSSRKRTLLTSADLELQLVQLNHCDGVYSNY